MAKELTSVAVYERSVQASSERVWENVHDWEHLPWLHAGSFRSIELLERGAWGWKARIGLARRGEILLELVREGDDRYVSRTLEGPGAGSEIWTRVRPVSAERTDVRVEFLLPGVSGDAAKLGADYTALYTRLWDEDEAMMRRRTALLREGNAGRERGAVALGPEAEVRARAPFEVEVGGRRFRVVLDAGEILVHSSVCPHWLGPLDDCEVVDGCVTCPWHGYRFDVRTGARRDATSPMRLAPAPRVVRDASGRVHLEV